MRKKELINENRFISEELHKLKNDNSILRDELSTKTDEISLLREKINELNLALTTKLAAEQAKIEEIYEVEETETEETENILDYGAVIIGKVIISAAENSSRIDSDDEERKAEAVSDIFERTEEVKAEILSIISSDDSYDKKCRLMEREYQSAVSFFDRTVARI